MANYSRNINSIKSKSQMTRFLGFPNEFRGVDVTSPERQIADNRFAHIRNMWKDYKSEGGACIETFPGWRRLQESNAGRIHGMWRYKKWVVVHIGEGLFAIDETYRDGPVQNISVPVADSIKPSCALVINGYLYLLDGENYTKIYYNERSNTWTGTDAANGAYEPTLYASHTKLDGYPQGYEQRNMLSDSFTESFVITDSDLIPDENDSTKYYLILFCKIDSIEKVTLAGTELTTDTTETTYYGVDDTGDEPRLYIVSDESPEGKYLTVKGTQPKAYFQDDYYKVDYASCIKKCTIMAEFDGRVFFTGNPYFPNKVWYSQRDINGYNRPDYIGELNYWQDGASGASNLSFLVSNDRLCVLQRNGDGTGGIYLHYGVDSGEDLTPRIYPSDYAALNEAPYGPCCNFRDDPVFLTPHGLDAIGKQQVNLERSIEHRSTNVDGKLWQEDLPNTTLCQFDGYLFIVCPSGNAYLADSRQLWQNSETGDVEYEYYLLDDFGDYYRTTTTYRYETHNVAIPDYEQLYVKRYERKGEDEIAVTGTITADEEVNVVTGWQPDYVDLTYEDQGNTKTDRIYGEWITPGGSYLAVTTYGLTGMISSEDPGVDNPSYKIVRESVDDYYVPLTSENLPREVSLAETWSERPYMKGDDGYELQEDRVMFTKDYVLVDRIEIEHDEPVLTKHAAGIFLASDNTLYMGALLGSGEDSTVICLNTDKRGEAYINNLSVLEPVPAGSMHRVWYSRCGEPYVSSLTTKYDDCGYPHVRKNTVRKSVDIELRSVQDSLVKVMWRTERENAWHEEAFDSNAGNNLSGFFEEDFGNHSFDGSGHRIFVSDEHAKLYTYKQIHMRSEELGSAFGIYHISYRWTVAGRIKN